ncbi:hypothetical protein SDC9_07445 [bioreactor metagenome]|uniref:Uncharacterized protein n=1 Tax=bioreactor metagenome TaxID=1076179 RepID=A0A644T4K5_9ZZZZ
MKKLIILLLVLITSISCINAVEYQEGQTYTQNDKQGSITFKITHITINEDGSKQYELEVINRTNSRVDNGINYVNNTATINKGKYHNNHDNTVKVPMRHTGTNWGVIIFFLLISALVLGHTLKTPKH